MSTNLQETEDMVITPSVLPEGYVVIGVEPSSTSAGIFTGERLFEHFLEERYPDVDLSGLTNAMETAMQLGTKSLGDQARHLVADLSDAFAENRRTLGLDALYIPSLYPQLREDGSVLFEWILPNFRLGFGLEDDPSQSGWYLVSDQTLGSITAYGYLSATNRQSLFRWLVNFLVLHS